MRVKIDPDLAGSGSLVLPLLIEGRDFDPFGLRLDPGVGKLGGDRFDEV